MKTRAELYSKEASDLLRNLTMYKVIAESQIVKFFDKKEETIKNILRHLVKGGRIFYFPDNKVYSSEKAYKKDIANEKSLWVLLEFIEKAEYHSSDEFPINIVFMSKGEVYEIIYVEMEKENLLNNIFVSSENLDLSKRIIIVEDESQIQKINIANTCAYCIVSEDGKVNYYQKE